MLPRSWPAWLEWAYRACRGTLRAARGWLVPGTRTEWVLARVEAGTKGLLFDCRMCGQCVLHSSGMICPMTCPKELRNGPCGGVRADGSCELEPAMTCVWVRAWERSRTMPRYGDSILQIQPPLDRRLRGRSAWVAEFSSRSLRMPAGWSD